jgi:phosphopantothenoylcysteine decarboxylase/phosphopantothenate--cysteine ligase
VSTLALSVSCQVLVAPDMNNEMCNKPAVQSNVRQLQDDGVHVVGPAEGWLSCQTVGPGRMAEPAEILDRIRALL